MMRRLWIAGALAIAALSGCSPGKVVHDKDYFAAHDAERTTTVAGCQKNPGQEAADANCINAIAAQADVDRKKAWTVTPPASRQTDPGKL
jgi:uncharacterized lipoprotein